MNCNDWKNKSLLRQYVFDYYIANKNKGGLDQKYQ